MGRNLGFKLAKTERNRVRMEHDAVELAVSVVGSHGRRMSRSPRRSWAGAGLPSFVPVAIVPGT
jgi:hypothetical protein